MGISLLEHSASAGGDPIYSPFVDFYYLSVSHNLMSFVHQPCASLPHKTAGYHLLPPF